MKKLLLFCLLASVAFAAPAQQKINILSFNINFGQVAAVGQLADFIREEGADLAALQEVDNKTYRPAVPHQNGVDILTSLGFHTGLMPLFGKSIDYAGGLYGLGILSRYPFLETRTFRLPFPEGSKEQRILLLAKVLLPKGDTLVFASVHADHSTSAVRREQVERVLELLAPYCERYPVVLCGDFNAVPDAPEIGLMKDWLKAGKDGPTFSVREPRVCIDYIFLYPRGRWKVNRYEVVREAALSDHFPLVAETELRDCK